MTKDLLTALLDCLLALGTTLLAAATASVTEVLDGRRHLAEVFRHPESQRTLSTGIERFRATWEAMSDEERRLLVDGRSRAVSHRL
ncbi:hypothetical protein [Pseudonocardia sp. H11422]|uniref:hypothetical protein n=1 Tax=Pseudonocardia sp. H11422 TaxID=2835866 RepID=UPI001BDCB1A7|nr:hypothetical protein [Pseudonocardia sp. H11422]